MIFSPSLKLVTSRTSAILARSALSRPPKRGTFFRNCSWSFRFFEFVSDMICLNVARSRAHSVTSVFATTDAARGHMYISASSPNDAEGPTESTTTPGNSWSPFLR